MHIYRVWSQGPFSVIWCCLRELRQTHTIEKVKNPSSRLLTYSPFVIFRCNSFLSKLLPFSFRFNSSLPLLPSFRFNSLLSFVAFFSFQLSSFSRHFLPFVSTLPFQSLLPSFRVSSDILSVTGSLRFKLFISLFPSFRFTSDIQVVFVRYFFPFVSPSAVCLLLELFRCNSFLSFITSFISFQLFPSVRLSLSFQGFPGMVFFQTLLDGAIRSGKN